MMRPAATITLSLAACLWSVPARAQPSAPPEPEEEPDQSGLVVRASVGTDVALGLGLGVGAAWLVDLPNRSYSLEVGADVFYSQSSETSDEGIHEYNETTELTVFAIRGLWLFGYRRDQPATFYIAGAGVAAVSVDWEERSPTDTSLGTPLPDGGSMQSEDGTASGTLWNVGLGRTLGNGMEVRLELPVLILFSDVGEASAIVPTIAVSGGYRF